MRLWAVLVDPDDLDSDMVKHSNKSDQNVYFTIGKVARVIISSENGIKKLQTNL